MKKYIEQIINTKTPHERRKLALSAATGVVALVAVLWVITLPGQLLSLSGATENAETQGNAFLASVGAAFHRVNDQVAAPEVSLSVASTSVFTNQ